MKYFLPNKKNLLGFVFIVLFVIGSFFIFLFLGGDPLIGDRGHESYSGTKISEIYSDNFNAVLGPVLYLPDLLFKHFGTTYNIYDPYIELIVILFYWYSLSCLFNYAYKYF